MADVQLENGYVQVANRLLEALTHADLSAQQLRIMLAVIRVTYGWRRRTVRTSTRGLADCCGVVGSGSFRTAFRELVEEGLIIEVEPAAGPAAGVYSVQKDFEKWGRFSVPLAALERRYSTRPARAKLGRPVTVADIERPAEVQGGYVYYIRSGELIKIGFSRNPWNRVAAMRTVRPDAELIAVEPGDRVLERDRHTRFSWFKIADRREWFLFEGEVEKFVKTVVERDQSPVPNETAKAPQVSETGHVKLSGLGQQGVEWATSGPHTDHKLDVSDSPYKELQAPKDIERQSKDITTTATAAATETDVVRKQTSPTGSIEVSLHSKYALGLTTAANRAISKKWGEQTHPLFFGASQQLAADLIDLNVKLELAQASIAFQVEKSKNPTPPKSIEYFRPGILQASQSDQQKALDSGAGPMPAAHQNGDSLAASLVASTSKRMTATALGSDRRDADMMPKYDAERRRAAKAWSDNPAHATRFAAIQAQAEASNGFLGAAWVAKAITTACGEAAGFPSYETWLAARSGTIAKCET